MTTAKPAPLACFGHKPPKPAARTRSVKIGNALWPVFDPQNLHRESTCATCCQRCCHAHARPGNDWPAGADGDPRAHSFALHDGWLQHPRSVARQRPDVSATVLASRGACPNTTGCRGSATRHFVSAAAAAAAYGRVPRHAAAARRRATRDVGLAARGGAGEAFAHTAHCTPGTHRLPPPLATSYVPRTCGVPPMPGPRCQATWTALDCDRQLEQPRPKTQTGAVPLVRARVRVRVRARVRVSS